VLLNSAPFFAALGARIWLGERLARRQAGGLVVGFAGILLIVGSQGGASGSDIGTGVVICLSGALGWAAAGLAMRNLSTGAAPLASRSSRAPRPAPSGQARRGRGARARLDPTWHG
jgi:drug/metabolite transporter (DMT)-like permease